MVTGVHGILRTVERGLELEHISPFENCTRMPPEGLEGYSQLHVGLVPCDQPKR